MTKLETWSREEVRGVIRFLWAKHVCPVEIHRQLMEVCGDGVMSVQHVRKWCGEFENSRTNIHNDDRTDRPSTSRTDVNAARVEELILENRRVTIRDLSAALELSIGTVHYIVHEELGFRKVCARWAPKCLSEEHKNRRFEIVLSHLQRFKEDESEFLESIVTGDET
jgi:histone-lysine N-methyltransferase SETMAR